MNPINNDYWAAQNCPETVILTYDHPHSRMTSLTLLVEDPPGSVTAMDSPRTSVQKSSLQAQIPQANLCVFYVRLYFELSGPLGRGATTMGAT